MARYSTPETRAYARDKAEAIGQAERIVRGELLDLGMRVVHSRVFPAVAVTTFFGLIFLAHWVVGQINL